MFALLGPGHIVQYTRWTVSDEIYFRRRPCYSNFHQSYKFSWINIPNQFSPSTPLEHVLLNDPKWHSHMWHTVLLAFVRDFKVNDLNSISCLLSMRLCRHANNRKFALTGIDQQPFIVTCDSEVSHDSCASGRKRQASIFIISHSGNTRLSLELLFHIMSHRSVEINWR